HSVQREVATLTRQRITKDDNPGPPIRQSDLSRSRFALRERPGQSLKRAAGAWAGAAESVQILCRCDARALSIRNAHERTGIEVTSTSCTIRPIDGTEFRGPISERRDSFWRNDRCTRVLIKHLLSGDRVRSAGNHV